MTDTTKKRRLTLTEAFMKAFQEKYHRSKPLPSSVESDTRDFNFNGCLMIGVDIDGKLLGAMNGWGDNEPLVKQDSFTIEEVK